MADKLPLIIITGAGASAGCFTERLTRDESPRVDHGFRPPLARELFDNRPEIQDVRLRYQSVEDAAAAYSALQNVAIAERPTLEQFMASLQAKGAKKPAYRRQFYEVLLYLQELFIEVGEKFLPGKGSGGNAYTYLVSHVEELSHLYADVAFVTLNYDLFLDKALAGKFHHEFRSEKSYAAIRDCGWSYTKLHGSVSWVRETPNYSLQAILSGDLDPNQVANARVSYLWGKDEMTCRNLQQGLPVMVAPTGSYTPACPASHLKKLQEVLSIGPVIVLCIGFSGADEDVFGLFQKSRAKVAHLGIVEASTNAKNLLIRRFSSGGPPASTEFIDNNAFSLFAQTELRGWLAAAPNKVLLR